MRKTSVTSALVRDAMGSSPTTADKPAASASTADVTLALTLILPLVNLLHRPANLQPMALM